MRRDSLSLMVFTVGEDVAYEFAIRVSVCTPEQSVGKKDARSMQNA
jgi:hypothetical protein